MTLYEPDNGENMKVFTTRLVRILTLTTLADNEIPATKKQNTKKFLLIIFI